MTAERSCIFCRGRAEKAELLRFVVRPSEVESGSEARVEETQQSATVSKPAVVMLCWDSDQRLPGRAAYTHRRLECLKSFEQPEIWQRALRVKRSIDRQKLQALGNELRLMLLRDL